MIGSRCGSVRSACRSSSSSRQKTSVPARISMAWIASSSRPSARTSVITSSSAPPPLGPSIRSAPTDLVGDGPNRFGKRVGGPHEDVRAVPEEVGRGPDLADVVGVSDHVGRGGVAQTV